MTEFSFLGELSISFWHSFGDFSLLPLK